MRGFFVAVLLVGLGSPVWSQDSAVCSVLLSPGDPASKLGPKYSPAGRGLKLAAKPQPGLTGFDHLETRLELGPNATTVGHRLVIARSVQGKPFDLLFVDADADGKIAETPIKVEPKVVRKNFWSTFETKVKVNHAKPGEAASIEEYPVTLWTVVEKEGDSPDVLRVSRRGFLTGTAKVGDGSYRVMLSDSDNDGVLGEGDWWELGESAPKPGAMPMRKVGDFAWAGGKAWRIELEGTGGRKARIISFDPGISEEEDLKNRDLMLADRSAERAAKPVTFRKDIDAAMMEVAAKKAPYFLKFETVWCGPCKDMTTYVFSAKAVADAATDLTSIVIDGDDRKDLTEKYNVRAYPTGILFNAAGKEIGRYVGYKSVKETTAFFKTAAK